MQNNAQEKTCPLCALPLYDGNPLKSYPKCGHTMHQRCLNSELSNKNQPCPLCTKLPSTTSSVIVPATSQDDQTNLTLQEASEENLKDSTTESSTTFKDQPLADINIDLIQVSHRENSNTIDNQMNGSSPSFTLTPSSQSSGESYVPWQDDRREPIPVTNSVNFVTPEENPSSMKPTETWACDRCTYVNEIQQELCEICEQGRRPVPFSQSPSDQGSRSASSLLKPQNDTYDSFVQTISKPGEVDPKSSSEPVTWSCNVCTYMNEGEASVCEVCEKGRRPLTRSGVSSDRNPQPSASALSFLSNPYRPPGVIEKTEKSNDAMTMFQPSRQDVKRDSSRDYGWDCETCDYSNDLHSTICLNCKAQRSSATRCSGISDRSSPMGVPITEGTSNKIWKQGQSLSNEQPPRSTYQASDYNDEGFSERGSTGYEIRQPSQMEDHRPEEKSKTTSSNEYPARERSSSNLQPTKDGSDESWRSSNGISMSLRTSTQHSNQLRQSHPSGHDEDDDARMNEPMDTDRPLENYSQPPHSSAINRSSNANQRMASTDDQNPSRMNSNSNHAHGLDRSRISRQPIESKKEHRVFIPDLPAQGSDEDLKRTLQQRLQTVDQSGINRIQCYSSIGLGVIYVKSEDDKTYFIKTIESIVFDSQKSIIIHFVDEIQVDSYFIVCESQRDSVTVKKVLERWQTFRQTKIVPQCEIISKDYPNIFKFTFGCFDDFISHVHVDNLTLDGDMVRIYHRASCSFFDGLPNDINSSDIVSAIERGVGQKISPTLIYVQCNPKTSTAIAIVSGSLAKWSQAKEIVVNNQVHKKRDKISLKLVISPISSDLTDEAVVESILFENKVIDKKRIGNRLILEFNDQSVYERCVKVGAVRVKNHMLTIQALDEVHTELQNQEMTVENWYKKEMDSHSTDLKTFLPDLERPFFKLRWNPQRWLQEFQIHQGIQKKESDIKRRLLRLTVMTDTIQVTKQRCYRIENDGKEEEIKVNFPRMRSTLYNNRSTLFAEKELSTPLDRPFARTKVSVINDDCLRVYQKLLAQDKKPLLLNMANAETPGGGYRQGAGAQEENIFRRSNYHLSLDKVMDTEGEADRYWRTDDGNLKSIHPGESLYPIVEFGAIHTSNITVFRDIEENGYAYLEKPITNVCAIAVAAYIKPELRTDDDSTMIDRFVVGTRKKIENLFAIAYLHKHDCLILSALGCGAFRNPPDHVALIFKSVIEQYAGYFDEIIFAIIDDHNTGGRLNPEGNYAPFNKVFDGFVAKPSAGDLDADMISGPFRIISKDRSKLTVESVRISQLTPCNHGALCRDLNDGPHCKKYSHPPLCSHYDKCSRVKDDKIHAISFIHRVPCQNGGMCALIDNADHQRRYTHPDYCPSQGDCDNLKEEHLRKFCHLPLCKGGVKCTDFMRKNPNHCEKFRHCLFQCAHGSHCAHFHSQNHMETHRHPFRPPCPLTPYACTYHQEYIQHRSDSSKRIDPEIDSHCSRYSHVCPFGRNCHDDSPSHLNTSIHIPRVLCPDKEKCSKLTNEEHLNSYTHPGIPDIRYLCHDPGSKCENRHATEHIRRFRHMGNSDHFGVVPYSRLNTQVNFVRNHNNLINSVLSYTKAHNWDQPKSHLETIMEWIRSLQPVHRCNQTIFESILVHGHVMSRAYMDRLRKAQFVANAVTQHPEIRKIIDHRSNTGLIKCARQFIQALVAVEFDRRYASGGSLPPAAPIAAMPFGGPGMPVAASSTPPDDHKDHESDLRAAESQIKPYIKREDLKTIQDRVKLIVEASFKLQQTKAGIGYKPDEDFGTNEQIFSILGPHLGHYYGDIFIVFKRDIMYHPDANFSIQAATTFGQSQNAYRFRPWLKDPGTPKDRIQHYHWTKLHCSVPGYDYASALELAALTGHDKKTMNVKLDQVIKRWMHIDSHLVFESHLPQLVPLDYIDQVYIPKNIFESMSTECRNEAKKIFRHRLTITDHTVDLTQLANLDATRKPYQEHVLAQINKKIQKNEPQLYYGVAVTLPASGFKEYTIIPMTIEQSCHRFRASPDADGTIYIYWQALGGDMMVALSRQRIDRETDQGSNRCLLCYVADTGKGNLESEPYSYITDGYPYAHEILLGDSNMKAKSKSFHRGCNIHDYITYCLILKRKIGQVVLLRVGSNGIYNHQPLDYQFQSRDLDLSTLNYVQISAYNRTVPVRNLIIQHEPIEEFHVSFDKNYRADKDSSSASASAVKPSPKKPDEAKETKEEKSLFGGVFHRIKGAIFGPDDDSRKPCRDSVHCLLQYCSRQSQEHNKTYSHPCRFSELCRSPDDHPHLEHIPHKVPKCSYDRNCRDRTDPVHRSKFRHSDLPDFLIPCWDQEKCKNKTPEHRLKYFHGEKVLTSVKESVTIPRKKRDDDDDDEDDDEDENRLSRARKGKLSSYHEKNESD